LIAYHLCWDQNNMPNKKQKFILVNVDGQQYAVPLSSSYHFFHIRQITPIPQMDKRIIGFTYHNGHLVTLLDTAKIFTLMTKNSNEKCAMVKFDHHYYGWIIKSAGDIVSAILNKSRTQDILKEYILVNKKKIKVLEVKPVLKDINLDAK
jgi:chemotaxis signal transduction protein